MAAPYPYPDEEPIAYLLWGGQSNAQGLFVNGSPADTIRAGAEVWNGTAFVPMAAGVSAIAANATTHALFNLTRRMLDEMGYSKVRVIMSTQGSTGIADWVGSTGSRTKTAANTPKYYELQTNMALARAAVGHFTFTHYVFIHGEADSARDQAPPWRDGTYSYDRVLLRENLIDDGFATEATHWAEVEVLARQVASNTWRSNRGIATLDRYKHSNVVVVPTNDFVGYDEGLTANLLTEPVDYQVHYTPAEHSRLGHRIFRAFQSIGEGRAPTHDAQLFNLMTPDGEIGTILPGYQVSSATVTLDPEWIRGGIIRVSGTCEITVPLGDLRTGAVSFGRWISFILDTDAVLTLNTQVVPMLDPRTVNVTTNQIVRSGGYGRNTLSMVYTGNVWQVIQDVSGAQRGVGASGQRWADVPGLGLLITGVTNVGANAGDTANVVYEAAMPAIAGASAFITVSGTCLASGGSDTGFTLTRINTMGVSPTTTVSWMALASYA